MSEAWKAPTWMAPYLGCIQLLNLGQTVEGVMNTPDQHDNPRDAMTKVAVCAQLALIKALMREGLLLVEEPKPPAKPRGKRKAKKTRKGRR